MSIPNEGQEDLYLTYNEWRQRGRVVVYGQKSHKRDKDGTALFAHSQTKEYTGKLSDRKPTTTKQPVKERFDDLEDDIPF